jgi:peroxiredoxin
LNEAASPSIAGESVHGPGASQVLHFALRRVFLTVLILAVCPIASMAQSAPVATALVHKKAPEFVRPDLDNKSLDIKTYRGKVVLLNFWATWCTPCQVEMPSFKAWQRKYGPRGLQVIGISMDDDPALVREASDKLKLNYPIAMGDVKLGDLYGGVLGLPMTFLIDRHGEIRAMYQGETNLGKMEIHLQSVLSRR